MQHNIEPLLLPYKKPKGGYVRLWRLGLAFEIFLWFADPLVRIRSTTLIIRTITKDIRV